MSTATASHPLDRIAIAAPCAADWDDMSGDGHVRHCGDCDKNVYDLSGMTRAEATALLVGRTGQEPPCLRLWRRADGTLLTADCGVGMLPARRRRVLNGWAKSAALVGLALGSLTTTGCLMGVQDRGADCVLPPPVEMRRAPEELARSLHELVPAHELIPAARKPLRRLPTAD